MTKLFPHIPFIEDETPLSWAARQAAFHTGGRLVPFLNDLQIPAIDFARGLPEATMRLCDKAGQDPEPVCQNTIAPVGGRRLKLRDMEFFAEFTTGAVTRICPFCLAEDQRGQHRPNASLRHRLLWRLAPVRTCPVHCVPLRDLRLHKWDDQLHEVQAMHDLINEELASPLGNAPRPPSELQRYVVARLAGQAGPTWMDAQHIDQATRATEMLGGLIAFGPEQKAATMTQPMWDRAGQAAWALVSEGHPAIENFLRETLAEGARGERSLSPRKAFGMLYSWLGASRVHKDPGPIRTILRDVIVQEIPLRPGQMVLGEPVTRPRLSRVASIASAEGMHPETLRNVLRVAGLLPQEDEEGGAEGIVEDYMRAKDLIDTTKHALPASFVAGVLNASRPMVAVLIELDILTRIHDHAAVESKVGKAIDGRSVQKVRSFIQKGFPIVEEVPAGFDHLSKSAERSQAKLKVILELLFRQHLQRVFRLAGHEGFGAILVNLEEIKGVLESPPSGLSEDAYFLIP